MPVLTVAQVKEKLPSVRLHVNVKGKIVPGRVVGRKNKFATVHTRLGSWDFSWLTVTRAHNSKSVLTV